MKKIFSILFVFAALLWSCEEKIAEGDFSFYEVGETGTTDVLPEVPDIGKRGIGLATQGSLWSIKVGKLDVHWHYSWGSTLPEFEPRYVDFVPMLWGKNGIDEEKIAELQTLKEQGDLRYLLGFNEPDKMDQANMTVDEAIEKWPMLEEVGVPLGSPAPADPTGDWLQEFMQKADANDLRVDFICVHWYGEVDAQNFLYQLSQVHSLYD